MRTNNQVTKRLACQIDWASFTVEDFRANAEWLLPQLGAALARLPVQKSDSGLIRVSGCFPRWAKEETLWPSGSRAITARDLQAIFHFFTLKRSDWFPRGWTQTGVLGNRYATNVPLLASFFKEYRNIDYSEWDWTDQLWVHLVDQKQFEWFQEWDLEFPWTKEELLELRDKALEFKTGPKKGTLRTLAQGYTIVGTGYEDFDELSPLTRQCLLQVWVFNPQFKHKLGINNMLEPDKSEKPLLGSEVLVEPPARVSRLKRRDGSAFSVKLAEVVGSRVAGGRSIWQELGVD